MDESLRNSLVRLVRYKFAGYPNILLTADDIVQDAYISLLSSKSYKKDKENYAYLSVSCIRRAYRLFIRQEKDNQQSYIDDEGTTLIDETDIIKELIEKEECGIILESLKTLRDIERVVITQRYYGDLSFSQIAKDNDLNLNTVLSHHRRALGKLRPQLTNILGYGRE
jgi:RNA polymerase sigma factor (sigma-70 family)